MHIAVVGLGSGGSAVSVMLAKYGVEELTLIDHDEFEADNLRRHILTHEAIGRPKVEAMCDHIRAVSNCRVYCIAGRFEASLFSPGFQPDLIACCADSDACCQLVNQYALENNIPAVFGAVHGAAETAEIITVIPGQTPCYACYEREGPEPEPSQENYTNPDYDATRLPSQPGLWADVLMAASIQFRAILNVFTGVINPLVLASLRLPYSAQVFHQKPGCAVCSDNMADLETV